MVRVLIVLGCLAVGLPRLGRAQEFVTGAQLAQACSSRYPTGMRDCDGYIAGVLDTVASAPELKGKLCPPAHTRLGSLREAVGTFGQQHPEATKGSGVALLQATMKAMFPCPAS